MRFGTYHGISGRYISGVIGRQYKILAAFTLETDIHQRHIPGIFDGAVEVGAGDGWWQLHHHRPVLLRVDEEIHVTSVDIGSGRLVLPAPTFRPPNDVVV